MFFTLPTALPTGQVFSSTSGHGLSADSARDRVRADEVIEQGCYLLRRASQLVALSGRGIRAGWCPLLGAKRTSIIGPAANDPERTRSRLNNGGGIHLKWKKLDDCLPVSAQLGVQTRGG